MESDFGGERWSADSPLLSVSQRATCYMHMDTPGAHSSTIHLHHALGLEGHTCRPVCPQEDRPRKEAGAGCRYKLRHMRGAGGGGVREEFWGLEFPDHVLEGAMGDREEHSFFF